MTESATTAKGADHEPKEESLWATLKSALRGTEEDMTRVPLRRAVLLLSVPMVLEMSMESLFTVVDMLFVSRQGKHAVATVGLTESMLSIIFALAMGMSAAATATIARKTGEKDREGASNAAAHVIAMGVLVSLVIGALGAIFAPHLLGLMRAEPEVIAIGTNYTRVMLGGSVTIFLLFVINAAFRGAGDAAMSMRSLWLANGLNMLLGPCLIFGLGPFPHMGVTGAAVATTISRGVGVLFQLVMLFSGKRRLVVRLKDIVLRVAMVVELLKVGVLASFQTLVETASWLGLVTILSGHGSEALAGYTFAIRVVIFVLLPCWGLGNAAATLVGQNLGAKEPERARTAVNSIAKYNVAFLAVVTVIFEVLARPLVGLFTEDPTILDFGANCLRIVALGFLFYGYGMVAVQAFNGAGRTGVPLRINVVCFWGIKIPLAYVLSEVVGWGPTGVFIGIAIAYTCQAAVAGTLFRRGSWAEPAPSEDGDGESPRPALHGA